jgi:NAD(P)-dependent dehydrogenase (short-subunit alcohol dehydrogenase family)
MRLDGSVALVTGGGRGIGRGVAGSLLAEGARVVVASRTQADLDETLRLLSDGGEIAAERADVSEPASVRSLIDAVRRRFGGLDILVCSHGVYDADSPFLDVSVEQWDRTLGINLRGTFLCGQGAARAMVDQGRGGRIINISSINGLASEPECADYNASKAAMLGLTRSMAIDLARHGITANVVAPGWIRSPMSAPYLTDEILSGKQTFNLVRRVGEPEDIGGAVAWLADPTTTYVTGVTIVVDGGQTAMLPMPTTVDFG